MILKIMVAAVAVSITSVTLGYQTPSLDSFRKDHLNGEQVKSSPLGSSNKMSIWGSSSAYLIGPFIKKIAEDHGYSYYAGGKNGEWGNHTIARLGAQPFRVRLSGSSIPAEAGKQIPITIINSLPHASMKPFRGKLNGVRGIIASSATGFTFARIKTGRSTNAPGEYTFIPELGPKYRKGLLLLWLGKNDISAKSPVINTPKKIVRLASIALQWADNSQAHVGVIGHFSNYNACKTPPRQRQNIEHINSEYARMFDSHYFDVPGYLYSNQIWADTKIQPTDDDRRSQHNRCLPLSLSRDNGAHLNDAANAAVAAFIEHKLKSLQWIGQ